MPPRSSSSSSGRPPRPRPGATSASAGRRSPGLGLGRPSAGRSPAPAGRRATSAGAGREAPPTRRPPRARADAAGQPSSGRRQQGPQPRPAGARRTGGDPARSPRATEDRDGGVGRLDRASTTRAGGTGQARPPGPRRAGSTPTRAPRAWGATPDTGDRPGRSGPARARTGQARPPAPRRSGTGGARDDASANADRPGWGGVTRRGARQVVARPDPSRPRRPSSEPDRGRPAAWEPEQWTRDPDPEPLRQGASAAVGRGDRTVAARPPTRRRRPPPPVAGEIAKTVGDRRAPKVETRLVEAAKAYERGRAQDAWRIVRPLAEEAPEAAAIRELAGLSLYRLGRWKPAINHLEAFGRLTGSLEQHPVLADSYRALGRHAKVEALWDELREASPGADLVTEGRIVMAGSLADRGDLRQAVTMLERGPVNVRRPQTYHLRLWYALADLHERVGDAPRARELFGRIAAVDPGLADTAERLAALA